MTTFEKGFEKLQNIAHSKGKNVTIQLWQNNNSKVSSEYPFGQPETLIATLQHPSGIQKVGKLSTTTNWTIRVKIPVTEILQPFAVQMVQDAKGNQTYVEFKERETKRFHFYDFNIVLNKNHMTDSRQNQLYVVLQGQKGKFEIIRVCLNFQNHAESSLTVQHIFERQLEKINVGELYLTKVDGVPTVLEAEKEMIVCSDYEFLNYHGLLDIFQRKFYGRNIEEREFLLDEEDLLKTPVLSDQEAIEKFEVADLQGHPMTVKFFDPSTNTGWGEVEFTNEDGNAYVPVKYNFMALPEIPGRAIRFLEPGEVVYPIYGIHYHQNGPFKGMPHFNAERIFFSENLREQNENPQPVTIDSVLEEIAHETPSSK